MPEALVSGAAVATEWLLTYLIHSSALIGVAWLAVRTRRVRAPESQDLLWKFAMLAGIATATAAVLPRPTANDVRVTARLERVTTSMSSGMPMLGARRLDLARSDARRVVVMPLERGATGELRGAWRESSAPSPQCRAVLDTGSVAGAGWIDRLRSACGGAPAIAWYHGVLLLWAGGAGLGLLLHGRRHRELTDLRASLMPASARAEQALADVVRGTHVRPTLRVSSVLDVPCVIGHDTIALPERCDRELACEELRAVLAHEVAHVCRSDVIWLAGLRVVCACLWMQPLNRLAREGFVDAAELVCDDWALDRTRQPLGLARSISRVAEWTLRPRPSMEGVVAMAGGEGRALSRRIRRILSGRALPPPASRIRRISAGAALLLPLTLLPAVPSPVARHAAIFVEQTGVVEEGGRGRLLHSLEQVAGRDRNLRIWFDEAVPGRSPSDGVGGGPPVTRRQVELSAGS